MIKGWIILDSGIVFTRFEGNTETYVERNYQLGLLVTNMSPLQIGSHMQSRALGSIRNNGEDPCLRTYDDPSADIFD